MAYKLMIENVITPLMPVTMTPFYVTLKITNIGDSVFPGGILTVFSVQSQSASRSVSGSKLPKIPPLKSGESLSLEPQSFSMFDGGVTRLLVELKANDDAPVDLFPVSYTHMTLPTNR